MSRALGIDSIYSANVMRLGALPYLMKVLADAHVTEAEAIAFKLRHDQVEPFTEELDAPKIAREVVGRGLL